MRESKNRAYFTYYIERADWMFNIDVAQIYKNSLSSVIYKKGIEIFKNKRVKNVKYDSINQVVLAKVIGRETHNIKVNVDNYGNVYSVECDCSSSVRKDGMCEHAVATLFFMFEASKIQSKKIEKKQEKYDDDILEYFIAKAQDLRQEVSIKAILEIESPRLSKLCLKIGDGRLYIVKNIRKFIEDLENKEEIEFGKQFSFDPNYHKISEEDKELMEFVCSIYDDNEEIERVIWGSNVKMFFDGKYVLLNNNYLKNFLNIVRDRSDLTVIWNDKTINDVEIINEDIDFEFVLSKENDNTSLALNNIDNLAAMTSDYSSFLYKNKIHNISKRQSGEVKPFYEVFIKKNKKNIDIKKQILQDFISHTYPAINKLGNLKIDESLKNEIIKKKLEPIVYLDKVEDSVTAQIKFKYGEIVIEPLKSNKVDSQKLILRNIELENKAQEFLYNYNFKVGKDYYYIDDEYDTYEFLVNGVTEIRDISSLYYSDKFRKISSVDKKAMNTSIAYEKGDDYLSFSFNMDGIEDLDLDDVLRSYKEKKKFYKLSDGSFLSFESEQIDKFLDLVECLGLDGESINNSDVMLPKYRAFYLNEQLNDIGLKHSKKSIDFKQLIIRLKEPKDENYLIPQELEGVLRDYQVTGYNWLMMLSELGFGGILADDMGLGKTLQTLCYLKSIHDSNKGTSLIVAPTSLIYNWLNEAEKFVPSLKVKVITGSKELRKSMIDDIENVDILITSYTMIRNDVEHYKKIDLNAFILDEAQHIKNYNSKTAKTIKKLNSKHRFALTGTPIENSLSELWSIFDFLMPGYLFNITKFKELYEKPIIKNKDKKPLDSLRKHIAPFVLRRIKKEVLEDLPEKIENKVVVELNEEQKKIYVAFLQKYKEEIAQILEKKEYAKSHMKILTALMRMRQICCDPHLFLDNYEGESSKLNLLLELLDELLTSGHRILIFSQFTSMLRIIEQRLNEKNIEYFYLDGSVKATKRNDMVNEFNKGDKEVFLISLKAGGTGLNLTGADTVIHFDPWWNPAVEMQAEDRAHRIGQEKIVHVMRLIARGTIEEKIYKLQQKKKMIIDSVIQPGQTMLSKLSEKEIRELFDIKIEE